ncbi:glycosyltransferase [Mongoliitalea lutea]|nr:glycosyltransferase [Mongoliitalea lutea]
MLERLGTLENVFFKKVGNEYDLGLFGNKVGVYKKLIAEKIKENDVLIPSDDEACWAACASFGDQAKLIGVLHSDDKHYFDLAKKYKKYVAGFVSVSNRIHVKLSSEIPSCIIPCGIQLEVYKFELPKENQIIWIGRLEEEQKRFSDIIHFAKLLKRDNSDWWIEVYGDGEGREQLEGLVKSYSLESYVILKGWQSPQKVSQALSKAKILLQTSNHEGMSVAVMEALASGCIILSSRVSGVEDLEKENKHGISVVNLFEIGNIAKAYEDFKLLASNDISFLVHEARALAEKHFELGTCLHQFREFSSNLKLQEGLKDAAPIVHILLSPLVSSLRQLKLKYFV